MVTINFILQSHGRRYGDKAAQISLDNDDGKKKVKDAVRVLFERNIPVKHWGTNEVKVLCSVLASERLDCKGQSFILTEEDLLVHCSLSSDKYVVVSPKEYDDIVVIDDEDAMDIDIKQEVDIKQEEEACDLVTNEVDSATTRRSAPSNARNNSMKTASSSSSRSPVRRAKSASSRALGSHIAAPTINTAIAATSRAERLFTVGSRHFIICKKGIEYPVEITKFTPRSRKYHVRYIDYPKTPHTPTSKVNLLEATAKRQLAYEAKQACTAKINLDAKERKTRTNERKKRQVAIKQQDCKENKKKKVAEKKVADKELKKEKAEATRRRKYEENQVWSKRFGERVYAKDLPVEFAHCAEPRTCLVQPEMKRTLYFAAENDTPTKIAKLFVDMPVERILYDNRQVKEYEELLTNTKLKSNSIILLPLTSSKR